MGTPGVIKYTITYLLLVSHTKYASLRDAVPNDIMISLFPLFHEKIKFRPLTASSSSATQHN